MAVSAKSLFLYGFEVTPQNSSIDFQNVSLGPELMATLRVGFYSLSSLMVEIVRALEAADTTNNYTASADRTINAGTENRVTISTSGAFLSLLFGSGTRAASTVAPLIGFTSVDQTGSTTYTGSTSCGTILIPNFFAFTFLPPEAHRESIGVVNVSSSGLVESVIFSTPEFWQCEFKYIPKALMMTDWRDLLTWAAQKKQLEFTPEITSPTLFYSGILEKSSAGQNGLGYMNKEMLPDFPNQFQTGIMTFRKDPE
jgi:hypothetical protein